MSNLLFSCSACGRLNERLGPSPRPVGRLDVRCQFCGRLIPVTVPADPNAAVRVHMAPRPLLVAVLTAGVVAVCAAIALVVYFLVVRR